MGKKLILLFFLSLSDISVFPEGYYDIVVAKDGSGDYTSITEAVNNLGMYNYQRVVLYIKKGIYDEKLRIEQDNITLIGEDRDSTIIRYSQLREDWNKNKDYIGPAVINIHADDIILRNLTIVNTQPQVGPHAFAIYGTGTRIILDNCSVISKGGDTVSLWNFKNGMYYHTNCYFEGAVDFVCPRGWCYISNSTFYELQPTAAIWHAAPLNKNQKFVIRDSYFDGVKGFQLGRHHYEAQFYLLHCKFSKNMTDTPIYRVTYPEHPERERPCFWGDRCYFYNCERMGEDYNWHRNNISKLISGPINPSWTFDEQWDPEDDTSPFVTSYVIKGKELFLYFNELLTIRGELILKSYTGKVFHFVKGNGRDILHFISDDQLFKTDIKGNLAIIQGEIIANISSMNERKLVSSIIIPNLE